MGALLAFITVVGAWALAARRAPGAAWAGAALALIGLALGFGVAGPRAASSAAVVVAAIFLAMLLPPLRRTLVSNRLLVW